MKRFQSFLLQKVKLCVQDLFFGSLFRSCIGSKKRLMWEDLGQQSSAQREARTVAGVLRWTRREIASHPDHLCIIETDCQKTDLVRIFFLLQKKTLKPFHHLKRI